MKLWIQCVAIALIAAASLKSQPSTLPKVVPATHKNYTEALTDRVKFDMIAIPGGTYLMGSPADEKGRKPDEGPQHAVEVKPFWMGKLEVTWDEYDLYWVKRPGEKPSKEDVTKGVDAVSRPTPPYADETFGHGREGNPVLCITHHATMEYCRWLSAKTGKTYRLPTEAEWEWACRAGTTTPYSFGDDPKNLKDYGWYEKNSDDLAQKVGKKKPNPWGLYDMHGNVAEWCIDLYSKDFYAESAKSMVSIQPVNLPNSNRYPYVARGGSWLDPATECRSASRRFSDKNWLKRDPQRPQSIWWMTEADYVGFRVVCPVEEQPNLKGLKSKVTRESD